MGHIDKKTWQRNRAHQGGKAARATNLYPLRKIVGVESVTIEGTSVSVLKERLECQHLVHPRSDMVGETNAYHRRCYRCFVEQQAIGSSHKPASSLKSEEPI